MIPRQARCADDEVIGLESGVAVVRDAQTWAHDHLVPLNVSLEVTLACNIRCVHCYNFDRDEPLRAPRKPGGAGAEPAGACGTSDASAVRPELTTEEILTLIAELRAAGCLFLSLTGGEVLSHPDLFRFLDRAQELNMAVQLLTNGTLLRPGMAGRLGRYTNLMGVSVSLYGATGAVHDAITQVSGSFRRTWAGVERLRAAGVAVRLKFIVMRQNAHETQAMMDGATERGYAYSVDLTITARHDGTSGSLSARVDRAQLEDLCHGPLRSLLPMGRRPAPPAEDFNCNCARGNCAISATGEVYPCVSVPWSAGNIRTQPFREIWRASPVFQRIRGLTLTDYGKCAPCPHRAYCSHDRGAAFTATGDYTDADPFVCLSAEIVHHMVEKENPRPGTPSSDAQAKPAFAGQAAQGAAAPLPLPSSASVQCATSIASTGKLSAPWPSTTS
jgi:AdoMet-dependent heme synthase